MIESSFGEGDFSTIFGLTHYNSETRFFLRSAGSVGIYRGGAKAVRVLSATAY